MTLWGYVLGTCISLTNVCVPELYILDFKTEYTCNIHALLTTHFHQVNIYNQIKSYELYASYSGCYTHQELIEIAQGKQ